MPRFAVLADVHLSARPREGRDLSYTADLLRRAAGMLDGIDRLVIVGDLTDLGLADEYDLAREVLGPRLDDALVVAGNHETVEASLGDFARVIGQPPAGRGELFGVPVLRLNTTIEGVHGRYWHGRLDKTSLELLEDLPEDGPLVVVMHHPAPGTVRTNNGYPMMHADNGDELTKRLALRRGQSVVFTGHAHLPDVVRLGRVTYVGCPPLAYTPHAFLVGELDGGRLTITTRRLDATGIVTPESRERSNDPGYAAFREPPVEAFTLRLDHGTARAPAIS